MPVARVTFSSAVTLETLHTELKQSVRDLRSLQKLKYTYLNRNPLDRLVADF